jgi:hypothetical protein
VFKSSLKPWQLLTQGVVYLGLAAFIGYFSAAPVYTHVDPAQALIKLSFSHAGQPIRECRKMSAEELAALAPNMRRSLDCPRERLPLLIELELDGKLLYSGWHAPTGLWKDGPSTVYRRFIVAPGRYRLTARLRDSRRDDGFDYQHSAAIELDAQQNFVIDFRPNTGGFIFL